MKECSDTSDSFNPFKLGSLSVVGGLPLTQVDWNSFPVRWGWLNKLSFSCDMVTSWCGGLSAKARTKNREAIKKGIENKRSRMLSAPGEKARANQRAWINWAGCKFLEQTNFDLLSTVAAVVEKPPEMVECRRVGGSVVFSSSNSAAKVLLLCNWFLRWLAAIDDGNTVRSEKC